LFAERCYACHGDKVQMGGLQLSTAAGLRKAAESGVIVRNDPETSRMVQALSWSDKVKMPPAGKIDATEIAVVKAWISSGAVFPEAANAPAAKTAPKKAPHWAFQPVVRRDPPAVKQTAWVRNPIDQFILAGLEAKGLQPAAPADKLTLLRRVTYD